MIPRDDAEVETEWSVRYTRPEMSIAPGTGPLNRCCVLSRCQTRAGFDATAAARIAVVTCDCERRT
jgi:hypothetical protein